MTAQQYDENLLLAYVEGDITDEQLARVRQWTADDPKLAALLRQMASDRASLAAMPDPPTPDWLMDEVDRQLERSMLVDVGPREFADTAIAQRHVMRRIVLGTALAAMLLIVAAVVISSLTGVRSMGDFAFNDETQTPAPTPSETGDAESAVDPTSDQPAVATADPSETPEVKPSPVEPESQPEEPSPPAITKSDASPAAEGDKGETPEPPKVAEQAEPEMREPAAKPDQSAAPPPGELLAGNGAPRHADLLPTPPGVKPEPAKPDKPNKPAPEARLAADDAMYNARQIRVQPALAQQMELRIVGRDLDKTIKQLNTLIEKTQPDATVEQSLDTMKNPPAQPEASSKVKRFILRVDPEQLPRFVAELQAARHNDNVQLRPRNLLAVGQLPGSGDDDAVNIVGSPWPTLAPDYRSILQQQMPQPAADEQGKTRAVQLPVTILPAGE